MVVKRGEIWWATLDEPSGSEPGYCHPVVIISSNEFNNSQIQTVIVAVITSNLRLADAPGNIILSKKNSGLNQDSVINISQLLTLDKSFITEQIGQLNNNFLHKLNNGIKLVLNI